MLCTLVSGIRIVRGPTRADRMLAAQLLSTTAVAIFLLLSEATGQGAIRNLALVFVALATLTTIAFSQSYVDGAGCDP